MQMSADAKVNIKTPFLALKASAGSGKTFMLAIRYIALLLQGAKPGEILALTFTKKATKEMYDRIKIALKELADAKPDSPFLTKLLDEGFSSEEITRQAPRIYREFLDSNVRIMTLDAFFNFVLKKFCFFVGLSSDYTLQEGDNTEEILEVFLTNLIKKDKWALNHLARLCTYFELDFYGFAHFVQQCYRDKIHFSKAFLAHLLALDSAILESTQKQLEEQALTILNELLAIIQEEPNESAIKALSATSFSELLALKFTWLEKDEPREYKHFKTPLKDNMRNARFCAKVKEFKETLSAYCLCREQPLLHHIAQVLDAYARAYDTIVQRTQSLTFDDCKLKTYQLLVEGGNSDLTQFFYFRMDNKIAHILIDEAQDTTPLEYRIIKPLIDEIYAGIGIRDKRSFFVVGDSKQSIYGFRGSSSAFFHKLTSKGGTDSNATLLTENLPYNFRTCKVVLDFVNQVFKGIFKQDYISQKLPPDSKNFDGFVRIQIAQESDDKKEAIFLCVLENLANLLDSGVRADDIAILCFANDEIFDLAAEIKERFPALKITPEARSQTTNKPSTKILLSALGAIVALQNALAKESNFNNESKTKEVPNFLELLLSDNYTRFYIYELAVLLGKRAFSDKQTPSNVAESLSSVLSTLGVSKLADFAYVRPSQYLLALIQEFELGDTIAQFLLELSIDCTNISELFATLESNTQNAPKDNQEGLKILTIHASKGLEFPYVIVLDRLKKSQANYKILYDEKEERVFLHLKGIGSKKRRLFDEAYSRAVDIQDSKDQDEANNVLYVACTRAKKGLILIAKDKNNQSAFGAILAQYEDIANSTGSSITPKAQTNTKAPGILVEFGTLPEGFAPESSSDHSLVEPIILKQQHFGTQVIPLQQEASFYTPNIAGIVFGEALHLGLEYAIGFGVDSTRIRDIIRSNYAITYDMIEQICVRIQSLESDPFMRQIFNRAKVLIQTTPNAINAHSLERGVFVEVPLLADSMLKRLDVLAFCAPQDTKDATHSKQTLVVLDYKSGLKKEEHIQQVRDYLRVLEDLYPANKCEGYIVYVHKEVEWVQVGLDSEEFN